MPILAPQTEINCTWQMPPAAAVAQYGCRYPTADYDSDGAKMAKREAVEALRRFKGSIYEGIPAFVSPLAGLLDPLIAENDLRLYAETQGMNFDAIVAGAARHFTSPSVSRRTEPLSNEELRCLFEDDQRAFGR